VQRRFRLQAPGQRGVLVPKALRELPRQLAHGLFVALNGGPGIVARQVIGRVQLAAHPLQGIDDPLQQVAVGLPWAHGSSC
jgi:hypothetical protein